MNDRILRDAVTDYIKGLKSENKYHTIRKNSVFKKRKKEREKNICIVIYVLIYFFCQNQILINSPTSTKRPGRNNQHLYLNQYMPPRRRRDISCNFQTTSSATSQKPADENLRDQDQSTKGGMSRIEFRFGTCYARCDGPCAIPHGLSAKTYPLLHWPATSLRRYHKRNLFSFISLHINIFGLQMVLMFVARSYLLRKKRVSGEITDFSHEQGCPYPVFIVFTTSFINQWASRIITLTFLSQSVDDESEFKRAHPHRDFLLDGARHVRTVLLVIFCNKKPNCDK
jgi:hypothetical protein